MARASMQIFWSVMMLLITATVFCVMVLVYQLSSNALYSRAIDAGVTVATVNDLTGSGVQIANANAAAVASISGGRELKGMSQTDRVKFIKDKLSETRKYVLRIV